MDINDLVKMVSALKSDQNNVNKFENSPVAFVEKFLGVDLPDDQVNALVGALSSNFLGQKNANTVDNSGFDFSGIIGKLVAAKFDTNGDGKLDISDLGGLVGNLLSGKSENQAQQGGLDLGSLLKNFKI